LHNNDIHGLKKEYEDTRIHAIPYIVLIPPTNYKGKIRPSEAWELRDRFPLEAMRALEPEMLSAWIKHRTGISVKKFDDDNDELVCVFFFF